MKYRIGQRVRIIARPGRLHPANCVGAESIIIRYESDDFGNIGYVLSGFTGLFTRNVNSWMVEEGYIIFADEHLEPILGGDLVEEETEEVMCESA
jgi:hypothetical protein